MAEWVRWQQERQMQQDFIFLDSYTIVLRKYKQKLPDGSIHNNDLFVQTFILLYLIVN